MGDYSEDKIKKAIKFLDRSKEYTQKRAKLMKMCIEKCKKDGSYDKFKAEVGIKG